MNYLANKLILIEIDKSKMTFCWVKDPKYNTPHYIINDHDLMTDPDTILLAKESMVSNLRDEKFYALDNEWNNLPISLRVRQPRPKYKNVKISIDDIATEDIIWRVICAAHIPLEEGNKRPFHQYLKGRVTVNFQPFKHYYRGEEVARSHWKDGEFCLTHGRSTDGLGKIYILMTNRIGRMGKFCGYSYLSEMKNDAILNLCQRGLMFEACNSDNPFSYYTSMVINSFRQRLNKESRAQGVRDDILEEAGMAPSFKRQMRDL